jgi:hypothetical protein
MQRTHHLSYRWWWYLNHVLTHRFSTVGVGKVQLQSNQTKGGSEMHQLFIFSPYPQTLYQKRSRRCI